jgi:hypothetical protein
LSDTLLFRVSVAKLYVPPAGQVSVHVLPDFVAVQPIVVAAEAVEPALDANVMFVPVGTVGMVGAVIALTVLMRAVAVATAVLPLSGSVVAVLVIFNVLPAGAVMPEQGWLGADAEL